MFTTLLLSTTLAAGQPPAPPPLAINPRPTAYVPAGQPPAVLPMTQPPAALPMTQPPAVVANPGVTLPPGATIISDTVVEEPPAATKYLFERTIAETRLGQLLDCRGITIYGWTEMSYNASSAANSNAPVYMIDRANKFLLNQNWLHVEKTLDTSKDEFQWGWNMDWILPGSDVRTTLPRGLWPNQINDGQLYAIDPFQFYAQAYLPGLGKGTTVKVGRFATHVGYELVQAPDTPFVSRSYQFQYDPFTHTGIWATTGVGENWTVGYGASTGTDTFIQSATNRLTFLGQLKWAPKEGKTTAAVNAVITNPEYIEAAAFPVYNFYNFVLTHKFGDKLSYVLDAGYAHMNGAPGIGSTSWYGAANYLIFNHTDKLTSTFRAEVFEDSDGFRTGYKGLYTELTYGVSYKLAPGVIIRPSFRYDNNSESTPFEGKQNLYTGTIDLIFRW